MPSERRIHDVAPRVQVELTDRELRRDPDRTTHAGQLDDVQVPGARDTCRDHPAEVVRMGLARPVRHQLEAQSIHPAYAD